MNVTFDESLSTDRDWIRFKLDDIVLTETSIDDATIDAVLARAGSLSLALLSCGQALYVKLLNLATEKDLGSQKKIYTKRAENLKHLLDDWSANGIPDLPDSSIVQMSGGEILEPDLTTYKCLLGNLRSPFR